MVLPPPAPLPQRYMASMFTLVNLDASAASGGSSLFSASDDAFSLPLADVSGGAYFDFCFFFAELGRALGRACSG